MTNVEKLIIYFQNAILLESYKSAIEQQIDIKIKESVELYEGLLESFLKESSRNIYSVRLKITKI